MFLVHIPSEDLHDTISESLKRGTVYTVYILYNMEKKSVNEITLNINNTRSFMKIG